MEGGGRNGGWGRGETEVKREGKREGPEVKRAHAPGQYCPASRGSTDGWQVAINRHRRRRVAQNTRWISRRDTIRTQRAKILRSRGDSVCDNRK